MARWLCSQKRVYKLWTNGFQNGADVFDIHSCLHIRRIIWQATVKAKRQKHVATPIFKTSIILYHKYDVSNTFSTFYSPNTVSFLPNFWESFFLSFFFLSSFSLFDIWKNTLYMGMFDFPHLLFVTLFLSLLDLCLSTKFTYFYRKNISL